MQNTLEKVQEVLSFWRVVSKGGLLREDSGDITEGQVLRSLINPVKNFKHL